MSPSDVSELPSEEEIDALLARARSYEPILCGKRDLDQCVPIAAELCRGCLAARCRRSR